MKSFIKIVFGNLIALFLFGFFSFFFMFTLLSGLLVSGFSTLFEEKASRVDQGSVLVFNLSANLTDSPPREEVWRVLEESFGAASAPVYSLRSVTDAVRAAAEDPRVSSMFLRGNLIPEGTGSGFAALRELRAALLDFRASGKPLIAYIETPTVRDYYVASAADRIIMNPYGMVGLSGLASQQIFIAGTLERYGIGVQVTRAGRFKSAVEMFTEEGMSEANRLQIEELLADLWDEILEGIGESRGVSVEELQQLADSHGYIDPEIAQEYRLVDEVAYLDEVLDGLENISETNTAGDFPRVGMASYVKNRELQSGARIRNKIAVVYMEGEIVDGEGSATSVGSSRYARELRQLRQDPSVRAIVIRVNSPGGSVTAAETIHREIALASEAVPVVVSFGSLAASGGYWVATGGDYIFSQPNTITGSIGVFGIYPNFQELANRHGVVFETVRTATFADVFSLTRAKTEEEMELIQELVDQVYVDFLTRVAVARGMSIDQVRELAEGRVWSGKEAYRHGLVDEIGGLGDAISYAAEAAGLDRWDLYEFPQAADFAERLAQMFAPEEGPLVVRDSYQELVSDLRANYQSLKLLNDPRGFYARLPFSLRIE